MAKALTARFCENARPKIGKDGKAVQTGYPDNDPVGLELRVSAEGRKVWTFRYRTLDGKQKRLTLGQFVGGEADLSEEDNDDTGPLTLKRARRRARQIRATVERGSDPAADKRQAKADARSRSVRTVDELADEYLKACSTGRWKPKGRVKRARTIYDETAILRRYVRPVIGDLQIEGVTRAKVKGLLNGLLDRGIGAQTNRTHAVVRQLFNFAIAEELVAANPATGFDPIATEKPRVRVLTDAELKKVWSALKSPAGLIIEREGAEPSPLYLSRPVAIILQLAALLLQRRSEISGMQVEEINFEDRTWLVPAERSKSNRAHLIPLPHLAVALIKEAMELAAFNRDETPAAVFPGHRDSAKAIRGDSVTHALADVAAAVKVRGITVHDLRRSGASLMASERLSIAPMIVSRILGHASDHGGGAQVTARHYAIYEYLPEQRRALEGWEALLLEIVGERQRPSNVADLRGVARG